MLVSNAYLGQSCILPRAIFYLPRVHENVIFRTFKNFKLHVLNYLEHINTESNTHFNLNNI